LIPESKYLYLWINFFTILVPLIRSFEPRIAFYKGFSALGISLAITSTFFLVWDIIFTHMGVWGFNPRYLSGIYLFGLPLGEYLFFITVPYACLFIYRTLNYFIKKDVVGGLTKHISNFIIGFSIALAAIYYENWYTFTTFTFLGLFVAYLQFRVKPPWLGRFYLAYAVCLLPFFGVNGILTGSGIAEHIVWYNDAENLGIRLGTIPVEDIFYGMLLILMTTYWYERFYPTTGNSA
jgi:lycopene cyclase domain-containing protein